MKFMKKILMAAVALICLTMTSVVFTSCGSDDDNTLKNNEYTLRVYFIPISEGELSQSALNYLEKEFNAEKSDLFAGYNDAKTKVDEIIDTTLSIIKNTPLYAPGCEYKIYFKMHDSSNAVVYEKTIHVVEDSFRME